ncbi:hypothetical protein MY5147_001816 [Beauveria neobassiana]
MSSAILQSLVTVHSAAEPPRRLCAETTAAPLTAALPLHQTKSAPPAPATEIELRPLPGPANHSNGHLELMSRRDRPDAPADAVTVVPTIWEPYRNRFRLMLTCATALAEGMSDSAAGALIPYMEAYYHIGYAQVSLIFVGQAIGFIVAAVFLESLRQRLGHARTLGLAQALMTLAYVPMVAGAPFPVVVLAFFLVGFGFARYIPTGHPYCGGVVRRRDALWSMAGSLRTRLVLLGSIFIFCYQGAEVSISGWVISFLIEAREGHPASVGYVTAGFWGGITLGRFLLVAPAQRIGEKRYVYALVVGALVFELLVWLVPNVVGNAVAVSIVGVLLGPVYPCAMSSFLRGMPHRQSLSDMGAISAFGSMGGAVWPFIVGLLAQAVDTWVLHPIVIVAFIGMLLCWFGIPEEKRRSE